jgi:hypothetical protein
VFIRETFSYTFYGFVWKCCPQWSHWHYGFVLSFVNICWLQGKVRLWSVAIIDLPKYDIVQGWRRRCSSSYCCNQDIPSVKFSLLHILWFIEAMELQAGSSLWCWWGRWWWDTVWATFIRLWLHLFYSATPRYGISLDCSRRILSHRFLVSFDKPVEIVILFHIISLVNVKWLRPCWCCSHLQFPRSFNKMSPLSYSCTDFTASFLNWQCLKRWVLNFHAYLIS